MKRRYAEPKNHKSIVEYDFNTDYIDTDEYSGYVSIIKIKKVKEEWFVPRDDGKQECILANGYYWLIFHPDNQKFAITALYNENKEIVEWYFDMVKNISTENGMPYMDDLYLDLVITKSGEIYILDENELKQAIEEKDITDLDYKLAHDTLDMLLNKFDNGKNIEGLYNFSNKYLSFELSKIKTV